MKEILADIKAKLEKNDYRNEEHVRLCLVARILQALGWNIWDPNEVNAEFIVVPDEDKTRVDVALFLEAFLPSVFIEIKAVGKMMGDLPDIERQMRDYNRNNSALFCIITDGCEWRFYYPRTEGEFNRKRFESFNLRKDNLEDIERKLLTFLRKSEIANDNARREAESYLQLSKKQQAMDDSLSEARRLINEDPTLTLAEALIKLVQNRRSTLTHEDAIAFIKMANEKKPSPPPIVSFQPTIPTRRAEADSTRTSEAVRKLNPDNPEDLTYAQFIEGSFGGTRVSKWNELIDCAVKTAFENGVPFPVLAGIVQLSQGQPRDKNYHRIEGTELWILGMDANHCWPRSLILAKKIRMDIKAHFRWREKDRAAHPGEEGLLQWLPSN